MSSISHSLKHYLLIALKTERAADMYDEKENL